nr:hypothetical protein [uncultured Acinetobacter sp.]
MKNLAMLCVLIAGVSGFNLAHAEKLDKDSCIKVLQAGAFNELLEDVCGFEGSVSDKFKLLYVHGQCNSTLTEKEVYKYIGQMTDDAEMRYKAHGQHGFCEGNIEAYADLVD